MATAAAGSVEKRKPVFVKVDSLKPGTNGHNLTVKVINSVPIKSNGGAGGGRRGGGRFSMSLNSRSAVPQRIAECLVGDETGSIVFTARNDQVDTMAPGNTVIIRNAKIDMFKGSMRLAVDKWGRVEVAAEPASFDVKEDNNLSLVEYELVNVEVKE
ncbi:unnamed protein product [Cuscuta campestris]|uniref:Single-stranded DNA binding protein Ssb-like OB fold domain-containing protein n=2 Tax=Cuscuta sect. Cleistogrammica TaxID=1824901 RepID=A0A484K3R3_9ASTE|nr:hypothetical protein DM860_003802 [Cuscuta australis]VFQ59145.1 unnamed protein product [Cuscuta campestris]